MQVGEGVRVDVPADHKTQKAKKAKVPKHACEWQNCQKNHAQKVPYPQGGTVARNSSYAEAWAATLEPWMKYGEGTDSRATLNDYRSETPKADYAVLAAAMVHPTYHTQKHHLISVNLFSNVSKLSHNAELVGYDVNHKNNGVCLPTYVADIVRHDLQAHRGNHPNNQYNSKIAPLLRDIETRCVKYCELDVAGKGSRQARLIKDLNRLSRRAERQIKAWKWLLRTNAHDERKASQAAYAARRASL